MTKSQPALTLASQPGPRASARPPAGAPPGPSEKGSPPREGACWAGGRGPGFPSTGRSQVSPDTCRGPGRGAGWAPGLHRAADADAQALGRGRPGWSGPAGSLGFGGRSASGARTDLGVGWPQPPGALEPPSPSWARVACSLPGEAMLRWPSCPLPSPGPLGAPPEAVSGAVEDYGIDQH